MRQFITVLFAIALFVGGNVFAQKIPDIVNTAHKKKQDGNYVLYFLASKCERYLPYKINASKAAQE